MNSKIQAAFTEVKKFYPEVTMVVINKHGQWNYCDDNFVSPDFTSHGDDMQMSILEDAAVSVESYPCMFEFVDPNMAQAKIQIKKESIGINGLQRMTGSVNGHQVISLSDGISDDDGKGIWSVAMTSTLPTELNAAKDYLECYNAVFSELQNIQLS
jgi:hypothetical protein